MTIPPTTPATSSLFIKSMFRRALFAALALFLLVYAGDSIWFQVRLHNPAIGPATSSVHRIRLLAVRIKNNKVDYEIDSQKPEEDVPCANSFFPHASMSPCWYVTRHANDPIPM